MAFSATLKNQNVMGNQRVSHYLVTADAASGAVATNLSVIDAAHLSPISAATGYATMKINTNAASAAANGSVMISSVANGDAYFLTVYGR